MSLAGGGVGVGQGIPLSFAGGGVGVGQGIPLSLAGGGVGVGQGIPMSLMAGDNAIYVDDDDDDDDIEIVLTPQNKQPSSSSSSSAPPPATSSSSLRSSPSRKNTSRQSDMTLYQGHLYSQNVMSEEQLDAQYHAQLASLGVIEGGDWGSSSHGMYSSSSSSSSLGLDSRKRPFECSDENLNGGQAHMMHANTIMQRADAFTADQDEFTIPMGQYKEDINDALTETFYFFPDCAATLKKKLIMLQQNVEQNDTHGVKQSYMSGWYAFHSFSTKMDHIYVDTANGLVKLGTSFFYMAAQISPLPDPTGAKSLK